MISIPALDDSGLPVNVCAGESGVLYASSEMLRNGILPCRPAVDIGYDIAGAVGHRFFRIQVKSTQSKDSFHKSGSYRFNVCRRKSGAFRDGYYQGVSAKHYTDGAIDFFVFVHLPSGSLFVVPADVIAGYKHHISLRPDSEYRNAWGLLREQT